jgi:predicted porin
MARIRPFIALATLGAALLLLPAAAAAQGSNVVSLATEHAPAAGAGWTFTPSIGYSGSWDDNALMQGNGSNTLGDYVSVINPRGFVDFNGKKGQFTAGYDGGFVLYRQLQTLNSYDQHGWFSGRRRLAPHVTLFANNEASVVPTTQLAQLIAVPFVRTGTRLDFLRGGVEAAFSKATTLVASGDFQWVSFDRSTPAAASLQGGHSEGGAVVLNHQIDKRVTLTADADLQHATLGGGQTFDVQTFRAGVDYKVSNATHVFGAGGASHLNAVTTTAAARTGPALRLGLTHEFQKVAVDLQYNRSFVPSIGFGGTFQNSETSGRVRLPIGRHLYATSDVIWRNTDPLETTDLPLRSLWVEGNIGYVLTPLVRVEAFFSGTHQNINRPGGTLDRNTVGFMVITAKSVRIH